MNTSVSVLDIEVVKIVVTMTVDCALYTVSHAPKPVQVFKTLGGANVQYCEHASEATSQPNVATCGGNSARLQFEAAHGEIFDEEVVHGVLIDEEVVHGDLGGCPHLPDLASSEDSLSSLESISANSPC